MQGLPSPVQEQFQEWGYTKHVPISYEQLNIPNKFAKDKNAAKGKPSDVDRDHLFLITVPREFKPKDLNDVSLSYVENESKWRLSTTIKDKQYNLVVVEDHLEKTLINAFPSSEAVRQYRIGAPFSAHLSLIETTTGQDEDAQNVENVKDHELIELEKEIAKSKNEADEGAELEKHAVFGSFPERVHASDDLKVSYFPPGSSKEAILSKSLANSKKQHKKANGKAKSLHEKEREREKSNKEKLCSKDKKTEEKNKGETKQKEKEHVKLKPGFGEKSDQNVGAKKRKTVAELNTSKIAKYESKDHEKDKTVEDTKHKKKDKRKEKEAKEKEEEKKEKHKEKEERKEKEKKEKSKEKKKKKEGKEKEKESKVLVEKETEDEESEEQKRNKKKEKRKKHEEKEKPSKRKREEEEEDKESDDEEYTKSKKSRKKEKEKY